MNSHSSSFFKCGRWDLNPHERNAHKILSLARLPVPTLPHIAFLWDFFISPSRQVILYQSWNHMSTPFIKKIKKIQNFFEKKRNLKFYVEYT